ncbi:hypothetical protein D3C86_1608810 [compost metagenome]
MRAPDARQEPDARGVEGRPRFEDAGPLGEVLARAAHALGEGTGPGEADSPFFLAGLLDHDDGIRARRQDGAGHDAAGFAGADGRGLTATRRDLPDDREPDGVCLGGLGEIARPDRVAVHGGVVEGRVRHG